MQRISQTIIELFHYFRVYRERKFEPLGLKAVHARYLLEICRNPGITQDKLSACLKIDKSNVARQMLTLEENGYVRRSTSAADRRVLCLTATEKTQEILPQIEEIYNNWEAAVQQRLGQQEKQTLQQLLDCVLQEASRLAEGENADA